MQKIIELSLVCILFCTSVYAKSDTKENDRLNKLEAVTVTANKVKEKIQDVPQSITVIGEDLMEEKGIRNILELGDEIPNTSIQGIGDTKVATFRGIKTSMFTNNNPVVIYVDGVPYYDRYDYDPSLANVEQIEVLRGPQGTLYGKDAIGAVINITTKKPDNAWHGSVVGEYGSFNSFMGKFNANGALVDDKLFAGVNAMVEKDDGWITNTYESANPDANRKRKTKLNAFLLYKPTDRLSIKLSTTHNKSKSYFMDGYNPLLGTPLSQIKRKDAENVSFDVPTFEYTTVNSQSLNIAYDFDKVKLESITIHKKYELEGDYDTDNLSNQGAGDGLKNFNYSNLRITSQELKFTNKPDDGDTKWVAGLYYENEKRHQGPYGYESLYYGDVYVADAHSNSNSETVAIYAQAMIPLGNFELTLGGRYQRIEKDIDLTMYSSWGNTAYPNFTMNSEKTWNTFLPKVALNYKIEDKLNAFASISKGYMPGGFNYFAQSGGVDENSFEPQKSINYEIGLKGSYEKFNFTASIFRMDIDDIHVYKVVESSGGSLWVTSNAQKAHSQGFEFEGTYHPTDNIEISAALGLIDAKYDTYNTGTTDLSGKRLEETPSHTARIGVAYFNPKGYYARADVYNQGKTSYFNSSTNDFVSNDSYATVNAKIGYMFDNWDIYAGVKNLTDEDYITYYMSSSVTARAYFGEPRKFYVGARYQF